MGARAVCDECGATVRSDNRRGSRLADQRCPKCGGTLHLPKELPFAVRVAYPRGLEQRLRWPYRLGWHDGVGDADFEAGRSAYRPESHAANVLVPYEAAYKPDAWPGLTWREPWPQGQRIYEQARAAGKAAQARAIAEHRVRAS